MARYIDADAFLKDETKRCGCVPLVGSCTTDNESLAYQLAKAPTADVVEVVRCKECKHATFYSCRNDTCYKGIICEYEIGTNDENFFCSYGERRTDNDLL